MTGRGVVPARPARRRRAGARAGPARRRAEPRSAIPWLSESIEIEDTPPPPSRSEAWRGAADDTITVTPLGAVSRDGVGLLPPAETGFARALWGARGRPREVAAMIDAHPDEGVPAARALFRTLLLAETDPPKGGGAASPVLARAGRPAARRSARSPRRGR